MIQNVGFTLAGNNVGVLLIHGLTGTPNEMRIIAKGLNRAGFTVSAMQLAGHCGDEADLCKTNWHDWYKSVEAAAEKLAEDVDYVFVAGLSMGALLALKLSIERPDLVKGVGAYGVTFRYDGWSIPFYAKHFFFLLTWFKRLGIYQEKSFCEQPPYGLKDESIRASVSASMLSGDSAASGLAGNPFPALAEMQYLAKDVRQKLSRVKAPCLIMHSNNDDIAYIGTNARLIERNVSGKTKFIALDDCYHMITIDRQRREVIKQSVTFFQDVVRELSDAPTPEEVE